MESSESPHVEIKPFKLVLGTEVNIEQNKYVYLGRGGVEATDPKKNLQGIFEIQGLEKNEHVSRLGLKISYEDKTRKTIISNPHVFLDNEKYTPSNCVRVKDLKDNLFDVNESYGEGERQYIKQIYVGDESCDNGFVLEYTGQSDHGITYRLIAIISQGNITRDEKISGEITKEAFRPQDI